MKLNKNQDKIKARDSDLDDWHKERKRGIQPECLTDGDDGDKERN
jgi:hypothetical protein